MELDSSGMIMTFGSARQSTKKYGWIETMSDSRNQHEETIIDVWLKGHITSEELLGVMASKYLNASTNIDRQ